MSLSADKKVQLKKGDLLFKKGNISECAYILKSGTICCFLLSEDKRVIPVTMYMDHGLVGEEASFDDNASYIYHAVALEDSVLVKVPKKDILAYLEEAGAWMRKILSDISARIENTLHIMNEHKIVDQRLCGGISLSTEETKIILDAISKN